MIWPKDASLSDRCSQTVLVCGSVPGKPAYSEQDEMVSLRAGLKLPNCMLTSKVGSDSKLPPVIEDR
jgi:hypothetical protein